MSTLTSATPAVVSLGIDQLLDTDRGLISGNRIGLVCNPASIDAKFRHTSDRLRDDAESTLVALFGPQHGFRSNLQDNMIETPHDRDARRQVPVFSLYSETREPTAEMLQGHRRPRRRSAGRRDARLHLRLHDGELHARRGPARSARGGLRSSESDRRRGGRGRCAAASSGRRSSGSSRFRCGME